MKAADAPPVAVESAVTMSCNWGTTTIATYAPMDPTPLENCTMSGASVPVALGSRSEAGCLTVCTDFMKAADAPPVAIESDVTMTCDWGTNAIATYAPHDPTPILPGSSPSPSPSPSGTPPQ
jgi:hypothetical protein